VIWTLKNPVWKSRDSSPSDKKLLDLLPDNELQIQHHNIPLTVLHKEMVTCLILVHWISESSDVWTQITYQSFSSYWIILDISAPVEIHTDWERFRSLAPDLISPRIQIGTAEEAEKQLVISLPLSPQHTGCQYWTHISETKQRTAGPWSSPAAQRVWKLWHETRDPTCKTAVNWTTKTILRTSRRKATERWKRLSKWGHTSNSLVHCEIPYEQKWINGTNHYSWIIRHHIPLVRKG
jgi:hypothetical protein